MARPREFDEEEALGAVLDAFRRKGFEGASMSELEAATGLKKQSLYRLYGDKRGMYLAALKRYEQTNMAEASAILEKAGSARERFQRLFSEVVKQAGPTGDRLGCFLCDASLDQARHNPETQQFVNGAVERFEEAFRKALSASAPYERDRARRNAIAAKLIASYFGLRVLVKAGAPAARIKLAAKEILADI